MSDLIITSTPTLLDFIKVVARADEDQIAHFTEMTGQEWDIDRVAIGNWSVPLKWCISRGRDPLCVGGFVPMRPGVYRDFFIFAPEAFTKENWFHVTRICRRIMDSMLLSGVHRLECVAPAARIAARPDLEKWYKILGYNKEGLRHGYCATGADAISYARVKH